MSKYEASQDLISINPAILKDGQPMTVDEMVAELNTMHKRILDLYDAGYTANKYIGYLAGQGILRESDIDSWSEVQHYLYNTINEIEP